MQRKRKISADPGLQPISENGNYMQTLLIQPTLLPPIQQQQPLSLSNNNNNTNTPPQLPNNTTSDIELRLKFVNQAICWLQEELTDMKQLDNGDTGRQFSKLTATVNTLRKMNTTFCGSNKQKTQNDFNNNKKDLHSLVNKDARSLVDSRLDTIGLTVNISTDCDCGGGEGGGMDTRLCSSADTIKAPYQLVTSPVCREELFS